jgi:hypothetical protein
VKTTVVFGQGYKLALYPISEIDANGKMYILFLGHAHTLQNSRSGIDVDERKRGIAQFHHQGDKFFGM